MPVRRRTTVHVYEAVVIKAGQAGLSAPYHLRQLRAGCYEGRGRRGYGQQIFLRGLVWG